MTQNPQKDPSMATIGCVVIMLLTLGFLFLAILVVGAAVRIAF